MKEEEHISNCSWLSYRYQVLKNKRVILGVTGGVAAYKAAEFARLLKGVGVTVRVVLTKAAMNFVAPMTFQALTGEPVLSDLWDERFPDKMHHIYWSQSVDAIIVAPATADFLSKLAHGLCDDLLTTLCLARSIPLFVAPAMNCQMWSNAAVQRNVNRIQEDGVAVLGPSEGLQACGSEGMGRMLEPVCLLESLSSAFTPKHLSGVWVLLTLGSTFESVDPVRGLTNRSSGKMGVALARACARAGARVTAVSGRLSVDCSHLPECIEWCHVETGQQMFDEVMKCFVSAPNSTSIPHIFIGSAAVSDWRILHSSQQKIKRSDHDFYLHCVPNQDILASVAALSKATYCVGFALESENLESRVLEKRKHKKIPLMFGNLAKDALDQEGNTVLLVEEGDKISYFPTLNKDLLATVLVEEISSRWNKRDSV